MLSTSESSDYRPAIDGLRAIAVLAVFIFHLNRTKMPGGFVGVDVFFVISGYLITSIILRDFERGRFSFSRFYQRRIARLLAAYSTVAVATTAGAFFIYTKQDLASAGALLMAATASVANLKFMWQGNYFVVSPDAQPFLHCWSLSVEEQFYFLFPAFFIILCLKARRFRNVSLFGLLITSFILCLILTKARPVWAFYLLPTRAWELLAGSLLACIKMRVASRLPEWVSILAFTVLLFSFFFINERELFPGFVAAFPVISTACLLIPCEAKPGIIEKALSWNPLIFIGKRSYSLYLWHWPIFSLVDYRFFLMSTHGRLALKIVLSAIASLICFKLIENPSRTFLGNPNRRAFAYMALGCSLMLLLPLGYFLRSANYLNADMADIRKGGIHLNPSGRKGNMILMGDSNGSMYGKMVQDVAINLDLKLTILSVAAGDPLPFSQGKSPELWLASLEVIKTQRPDFLIFACSWDKLNGDKTRLFLAVEEFKKYAHHIILLTKPPVLPLEASREAIRNGSHPPFFEESSQRLEREVHTEILKSMQQEKIAVLDITPIFLRNEGAINFIDDLGHQLFQDAGHLSSYGADLVKPELCTIMLSAAGELPTPESDF